MIIYKYSKKIRDMVVKLLLPVFCFGIVLYGVFLYLFDHERNSCEMTYMFENPEYIEVPLKQDVVEEFSRYNLFIYGEGKYAEELRTRRLSGIPVLFVPGNAGSYRQVRSIASVMMRMGHSLRASFQFNVFAIDFREEISALYGGVLKEQTLFVQKCINHIQSLYSTKEKKLIVIGHSMGGVILRAVFSIPDFDHSIISAIYTLASPHKGPVLALDSALVQIYNEISETWNDRLNSELSQIPIISIGGGERDYVVRSELTSLGFRKNLEYHAVSTAIPGVWVSTDHLAIIWCKQLVLNLARSMFDLIDAKTKQVTTNLTLVDEILVHHFIQRSYGGHFSKLPALLSSTFTTSAQWIEQDELSWRFSHNIILTSVYIMIPLIKGENILVIASGLVKKDWVYACTSKNLKNETKTCSNGHNISKLGRIIPSKKSDSERRVVNLVSRKFIEKGYSHILVSIPPTNSQIDLLGERYKVAERHKKFAMPSILERISAVSPVRVVSFLLADHAVFYNVTLSGLSHIIEASTLTLETRICRAGSTVGQGIINLHIPWSNEDLFYHIKTTLGGTTTVPVKLHKLSSHKDQDVQVHFMLDPECSYVLFASFSWSNIISQFVKFYGLFIPGYSIALFVSIVSGQMYAIGTKDTCPSALYILGKFPTYLSLVLLPSILYHGIWITGFYPSFLPVPDHIVISKSHSFYSAVMVRSILYVASYGMVASCSFIIMKTFSLCSSIWIWFRRKSILKVTETPLENVYKMNFKISYWDAAWCALLAAITVAFSGAVAMCICLYFYCSKLFNMLIKCKAEEERRGFSAATSKWHFHVVLTILWTCTVLLTMPGLITWGRNLSFSLKLFNDPHVMPCIMLIHSSGFLWQLQFPLYQRVYNKTASHIIHFIALLISLYGIESMFRLVYFINVTFAVISLQQFLALMYGNRQLKLD